MKSSRISILLLLLAVIGLSTCSNTKKVVDNDVYQPLPNALLWEISGNNLSAESYLFGTIHLIEADRYFLPKGTLQALDKSNKVVLEIDLSQMEDMGAMMSLMSQAMLPLGTTLKSLVTEEEYEMVHDHFAELGLPAMIIDQIKPMFLSFMTGDFDMTDLSGGEMVSYEMKFQELAQANNKEIGGLETIEYQMSVFDSIPYEEQADMLVESIQSGSELTDQLDALVSLYEQQNIEALAQAIKDEGSQQMETILLTRRNQDWIPRIGEMAEAQPIFFAVGAGHLAGPQGVIHLLREAGYTVKPIIQE